MFEEENKPSLLKIWWLLKSKIGKNCIELWPTIIVTKRDMFHIFKLTFFKVVINWVFQGLPSQSRTFLIFLQELFFITF